MHNNARASAMGRMEPEEQMPIEQAPQEAPTQGGEISGLMTEITSVLGQVAQAMPPDKQALVSQAIELLQQVAGEGTPEVAPEPSLPTAAGAGVPPSGPM